MSIQYYYGQEAVRHILQQRGGRATIDEIKHDMQSLIKQHWASASMTDAPLNRALGNLVKWQEVKKVMGKHGHLQYYELSV